MIINIIVLICIFIILNRVNSQTWILTTSNSQLWNCIAASESGLYLIAGVFGGGIYISNNSANSWHFYNNTQTNQASFHSVAISFTGQYQLAGSSNGLFLSSTYGSLFQIPTSIATINISPWQSVTMNSNGQYMAAVLCCGNGGSQGGIYYSTNHGVTWSQSSASSKNNWISVSSNANGNQMYAINRNSNYSGVVYTSSNNGMNWTSSTNTPKDKILSQIITSASGQYVALASYNDSIFISSNNGVNWAVALGTSDVSWNDIVIDSTGQYYVAVGDNSTIFSSYNYGKSFVNNNPTTNIGDATGISSNGTFGTIFISTSNSGKNNPSGKSIFLLPLSLVLLS